MKFRYAQPPIVNVINLIICPQDQRKICITTGNEQKHQSGSWNFCLTGKSLTVLLTTLSFNIDVHETGQNTSLFGIYQLKCYERGREIRPFLFYFYFYFFFLSGRGEGGGGHIINWFQPLFAKPKEYLEWRASYSDLPYIRICFCAVPISGLRKTRESNLCKHQESNIPNLKFWILSYSKANKKELPQKGYISYFV